MTSSHDIVIRPRITEKSGVMNESLNIYTFEVAKTATKRSLAYAIKTLYKVTPLKINIVNLPSGVKKAMVFIKKGDKIEVV